MKYIDFIFINLYDFYLNRYGLKYSTPQGYTIYAMAIGVVIWSTDIVYLISHFFFHDYLYNSYLTLFTEKISTNLLVVLSITAIFYYLLYLKYLKSDYYVELSERFSKKEKKRGDFFISVLFTVIIPLVIGLVIAFVPKK